MPKTIIAFTGKKQSGKTTAADYLCAKHGFKKIGFKDALVAEVIKNFPDLLKLIFENDKLRFNKGYVANNIADLFFYKPPLVRTLLQNYGTEVRRRDDRDYWLHKWMAKVESSGSDKIVVDDVRFINEANIIREMGGKIYLIDRPNHVDVGDKHSTEMEMINIKTDGIIDSSGSVSDLNKNVEKVIHSLLIHKD